MRNKLILATIALVMTSSYATAGEMFKKRAYTPYVTVGAGATFVDDTDFNFESGPAPVEVNNEYDTGYVVYGEVGYNFGKVSFIDNVKLGLEVSRSQNDIDVHSLGGPGAAAGALTGPRDASTGELTVTTIMANMYHEFDTNTRLVPYYGIGAGLAILEADNYGVDVVPSALDDDAGAFAYSLMAGVNYMISEKMDLGVRYKYLSTVGANWRGNGTGAVGGAGNAPSQTSDLEYQNSSVSVNLTYNF